MLEWGLNISGTPSNLSNLSNIPLGPVRKVASATVVFPSVERPAKVTLSARVGNIVNDWDFWVFPPRARRDGRGLAVAPTLKDSMSRLYDGVAVLGTPEAERAAVIVVEQGSSEEEAALKAGRRVVAIGAAKGVPNVKLGWWWMGTQVGTALVDHPVFAGLPHEGHLSPLLFRIVGVGLPLRGAGREVKDLLMVGEGGQDCFAYVALRRDSKGLAVESFGLDLLSGKPEANALLDGMIDYAREAPAAPR